MTSMVQFVLLLAPHPFFPPNTAPANRIHRPQPRRR